MLQAVHGLALNKTSGMYLNGSDSAGKSKDKQILYLVFS